MKKLNGQVSGPRQICICNHDVSEHGFKHCYHEEPRELSGFDYCDCQRFTLRQDGQNPILTELTRETEH